MIKKQPHPLKVIAHRGLTNIFPENTIQALTTALCYADLAQLDILLTKDHQIIVFHDRALSAITDVDEKPEFSQRKHIEKLDGQDKEKNDWWVRDFTLDQLKNLRVFQRSKKRPKLAHLNFTIPTLEQLLIASLEIKKDFKQKFSGLLVQIKSQIACQFSQNDKILMHKLCDLLKKYELDTVEGCQKYNLPIIIQSFELPTLKQVTTQNHIYQLFDKDVLITEQLLTKEHSKNVKGIGITKQNLKNANVRDICDKFNYELLYWTLKDDEKDKDCQNYNKIYQELKSQGVNGFITQFPDKCRGVLELDFD